MKRLSTILYAVCLLLTSIACSRSQDPDLPEPDVTESDLTDLTSEHVRVVWVQDHSPESRDVFAEFDQLTLVGFDSRDGKGVRTINNTRSSYSKPFLTPDGKQIIYSDIPADTFYIVNWDGSGTRKLGQGYALDAREDPETHAVWIYVGTKPGTGKGKTFSQIERVRLSNPKERELVWNQTSIDADNFMVSLDGSFAATLFPWPLGGIAYLPNKRWEQLSRGCWPSMAPDQSGTFMIFDGPHKNMTMYAPGFDPHVIPINNAEGIGGYEVYHPRWSNHARFMAMTGPFTGDGSAPGGNRIGGGGASVEIYLGRFAEDYRSIEHWEKITENTIGDFYPDMWVAGGEKASMQDTWKDLKPRRPDLRDKTAVKVPKNFPLEEHYKHQPDWPGYTQSLEYLWEDSKHSNQIILPDGKAGRTCNPEVRGLARFASFFEADVDGGFLRDAQAGPVAKALKASDEFALEMTITPHDLTQEDKGVIFSLMHEGVTMVEMSSKGTELFMRLRTDQDPEAKVRYSLGTLLNHAQHFLFNYRTGKFECFVDGQKTTENDKLKGDFSNWPESGTLTLGAGPEGAHDWQGLLEGIAIYSRNMPDREVMIRSGLAHRRIDDRVAPKQVVVEARLDELSPTPTPKAIAPYTRCLASGLYTVTKVIEGADPGKEITVDHWVILDSTVLDTKRNVGQTYRLTLERLADHPQIKSERRVSDLSVFDDLPEYIEAGMPGRIHPVTQ